jgi:hypothetical protein
MRSVLLVLAFASLSWSPRYAFATPTSVESSTVEQREGESDVKKTKPSKPRKQAGTKAGFAHYQAAYPPGFLEKYGPVLLVQLSAPESLTKALRSADKPEPPPRFGVFIVDTGSNTTSASEEVLRSIGLQPIGTSTVLGIGGQSEARNYFAGLTIQAAIGGRQVLLRREMQIGGSTALDFANVGRTVKLNDKQVPVIGLIGNDVLRSTQFEYDGIAGTFTLDLDLSVWTATDLP